MTLLREFQNQLSQFLTGIDAKDVNLIKFHDQNQSSNYDYSFTTSIKIWYIKLKELSAVSVEQYNDNLLAYCMKEPIIDISQALEVLKQESKKWIFTIASIEFNEKQKRCYFSLDRARTFTKLMSSIENDSGYGKKEKIEEFVSIETEEHDELSCSMVELRMEIISRVVRNLISYSKYNYSMDPTMAQHKIQFITKINPRKDQKVLTDRKRVLCGAVNSPVDNKISHQTASEYLKKRCSDMHLISIHKFGVRAKNDGAFQELINDLGMAAVIMDLVEVKHSSPMVLRSDAKQAFILYNSARLETLIDSFDKKVLDGFYPELPPLAEIDLNLLKEPEEWQILRHILIFPDLIERSMIELTDGKVHIHLIYKFLSSMASTFSVYYRRVRLLTENRSQLMPVLFAKVHLLRCFQRIFNAILTIFDIRPVSWM